MMDYYDDECYGDDEYYNDDEYYEAGPCFDAWLFFHSALCLDCPYYEYCCVLYYS